MTDQELTEKIEQNESTPDELWAKLVELYDPGQLEYPPNWWLTLYGGVK